MYDYIERVTCGELSAYINELDLQGKNDKDISVMLYIRWHYLFPKLTAFEFDLVLSQYRENRELQIIGGDVFDCVFIKSCGKKYKSTDLYKHCLKCEHYANCGICQNADTSVCQDCKYWVRD